MLDDLRGAKRLYCQNLESCCAGDKFLHQLLSFSPSKAHATYEALLHFLFDSPTFFGMQFFFWNIVLSQWGGGIQQAALKARVNLATEWCDGKVYLLGIGLNDMLGY